MGFRGGGRLDTLLDVSVAEGASIDTMALVYDNTSRRWVALGIAAQGGAGITGLYGDGSDGDVIINVDTNLSRDMFYNNLTVTAGAKLNTAGFRVYVKGTCQIDAGCAIHRDGQDAGGSVGGLAHTAQVLGGASQGGNSTTGVGGNGTNSPASSIGGTGGGGGAGTSAGGTGGTVAAPAASSGGFRHAVAALTGYTITFSGVKLAGGAGAGAGGGDGVNSGGGGGGGAAHVVLCAFKLVNNGRVSANGGIGATRIVGNVGGGGGGGGGAVFCVYRSKSGAGVITASGGVPGNGFGTGVAGIAGGAGTVVEATM